MNQALLREIVAILVQQAKANSTITYGELSRRLDGAVDPQGFYKPLVLVSECAERNGYPKLSALVVNSQSGIPGRGFFVNFASGLPEYKWKQRWDDECFDIFFHKDWDSFLRFF